MKRHVAATLLALTALGVLNAHVDVEAQDGRYFAVWQGKKQDVIGWLDDRSNQLWRDCSEVASWPAGSPQAEQVLALIREYSPPDSRQAQVLSLQQQGPWLVAELGFETLNPAVVLLRQEGSANGRMNGESRLHLPERAIWSGSTEPWRPGPRIRTHLKTQAPPDAPEPYALKALLACYEPLSPGLR